MKDFPRSVLCCGVFAFAVLFACGLVVTGQEPASKTTQPGFLTPLELEVIQEINLARAEPQKYATYLQECRKYYNGNSYLPPSRTKPLTTFDGIAAVDEAIRFLQASKPLGPLQPSLGLSFGAKDHAQDMALKGTSGHRGSDGSLPNDRISRYGAWKSTVGEAIVYRVTTAREMVLDLIVDDGNPGRPHRKNIFEPSFQLAGVSISPQSNRGSFCVIDYAGGFAEKAGLKWDGPAAMTEVKSSAHATAATPATKTTPTTKTTSKTPTTAKPKTTKTTKRG